MKNKIEFIEHPDIFNKNEQDQIKGGKNYDDFCIINFDGDDNQKEQKKKKNFPIQLWEKEDNDFCAINIHC